VLNGPISPYRALATIARPMDELRAIKRGYGCTINDVVLAASTGGVRRHLERHGERPARIKAMVPVNVRDRDNGNGNGNDNGNGEGLGNHISFMFVELPCDEPDPVRRLLAINRVTSDRKLSGEPQGADTMLKAAAHSPHRIQHAITRLVASPRTFNLVVSNIPGPRRPLYMRGCRLVEAYPIVPLAERHAVSIGVTSIAGRVCFGLYADRKTLPDVDLLASDLDDAIDELLAGDPTDGHRERSRGRERRPQRTPA
jgi:WS/DGAT/MGAT family acyltransferase